MEKYIFLDFDGVLNTPKGKFDKKAIDNLRYLLERSDAKEPYLYAILDDKEDILVAQRKNLVKATGEIGMSKTDMREFK